MTLCRTAECGTAFISLTDRGERREAYLCYREHNRK